MEWPQKVTDSMIYVAGCLRDNPSGVHGYLISKSSSHPGPTVYGLLDKMHDHGWVIREWDTSSPGPARHIYRLTPLGEQKAEALMRAPRPAAALAR